MTHAERRYSAFDRTSRCLPQNQTLDTSSKEGTLRYSRIINRLLTLFRKDLTAIPGTFVCAVRTGKLRPFIHQPFRRIIFHTLHNLQHPGGPSTHLITSRYVWKSINVRHSTCKCLQCQRSKTLYPTRAPLASFQRLTNVSHIYISNHCTFATVSRLQLPINLQ